MVEGEGLVGESKDDIAHEMSLEEIEATLAQQVEEPSSQCVEEKEKHLLDAETHELMETIMPFQVPVPSEKSARDGKLPPGRKFCDSGFDDLAQWIAKSLGKLSPDLQQSLRRFHEAYPMIRVGTACSGTDAPLMMVRAYQDALGKYKGLLSKQTSCEVGHAFSCEKNVACLRM